MPNTKRSSKVKDRDWDFLAKLLEWTIADDEQILKHPPHRPCWSSVSKGFKLSVEASTKDFVELTGLKESEVKSAIKRLEHQWKLLTHLGPTQGKKIWQFFLLLPSRDPEVIKALFEKEWEQLNADASRISLSPATLHQKALTRLKREQRWLTICRLTTHQGTEKALDSAGFVAPFLIEFQGVQEVGSRKTPLNSRVESTQQQSILATPLDYQTFLDQVLSSKQSRKSDGSRIAIIGEPGSGKSTLLQHTALWLAEEREYLPVWISLSQLCQTASSLNNLEAYILNDWLSVLLPDADSDTQKLFRQICIQGKVCLFIDGIDEASIKDTNETAVLERQLKSSPLLSRMMVVATCRADHWNNARNSLQLEFDTYQLLDLVDHRFPGINRVNEFILRWFRSNPNLGQLLIEELNKPENLEIKELMSNRLCLALLCHRWTRWCNQKGLPSSRIQLYERYVDDFFSWKPELAISRTTQRQMKRVLGELAYRALEQELAPFQLSSHLVEQVWEERKLPERWLETLQDIGILYPIQIVDNVCDL
jgi:predicted NACHT family NTPase